MLFRVALISILVLGLTWHPADMARGQSDPDAEPRTRAISSSRQFVAYADTPLAASALCVFAERVRNSWADLLQDSDKWKSPIIILAQPPGRQPGMAKAEEQPVRLEIFHTAFGFKLQVSCVEPPSLNEDVLLRGIVEALCAEFMLRRATGSAPVTPQPVPLWLVAGLSASIRGQPEILRPWVRQSVQAGNVINALDLLQSPRWPSQAVERERFEAHAWLLTEGLLTRAQGTEKLRRYLQTVATGLTAEAAFDPVYGTEFPTHEQLEKWWALQLVYRARLISPECLSTAETAAQLESLLLVRLLEKNEQGELTSARDEPLSDLWRHLNASWFKPLLNERLAQLQLLRSHGHPLYDHAITRYAEAVLALRHGTQINRFRRGMRMAAAEHARADERARAISEHLDRVERIVSPVGPDELFRGYFDALREIEQQDRLRQNPIDDYLNRFDR